jgi:hypothetical protein
MTYTVKEKNKLFYLYNTNTRRMLTKGYNSVVEAKAAVNSVNRRGKGARKYHACCRKANCGKKNKQKATPKKLTKKATSKTLPTATPTQLPVKKKKKRRVALRQAINNSGSGKKILGGMTKGQKTYQSAIDRIASKYQ